MLQYFHISDIEFEGDEESSSFFDALKESNSAEHFSSLLLEMYDAGLDEDAAVEFCEHVLANFSSLSTLQVIGLLEEAKKKKRNGLRKQFKEAGKTLIVTEN